MYGTHHDWRQNWSRRESGVHETDERIPKLAFSSWQSHIASSLFTCHAESTTEMVVPNIRFTFWRDQTPDFTKSASLARSIVGKFGSFMCDCEWCVQIHHFVSCESRWCSDRRVDTSDSLRSGRWCWHLLHVWQSAEWRIDLAWWMCCAIQ